MLAKPLLASPAHHPTRLSWQRLVCRRRSLVRGRQHRALPETLPILLETIQQATQAGGGRCSPSRGEGSQVRPWSIASATLRLGARLWPMWQLRLSLQRNPEPRRGARAGPLGQQGGKLVAGTRPAMRLAGTAETHLARTVMTP